MKYESFSFEGPFHSYVLCWKKLEFLIVRGNSFQLLLKEK